MHGDALGDGEPAAGELFEDLQVDPLGAGVGPLAEAVPDLVGRAAELAVAQTVGIVAEKLTYDETTRKADYTGQARLIQGDTSIQADALTIDETKGDLSANGKVVTTLAITEKDSAATTKPKPMVGRAGVFAYSDQTRTATYTTSAQLDGDQGNLRGAKIEMKLAKEVDGGL